MIRQIALATDINGAIGQSGRLLCTSTIDMANFARFTQGTLLIAGRKSMAEMMGNNFTPSASRPVMVITSGSSVFSSLPSLTASTRRHIYFAKSLEEALSAAPAIASQLGLLGYTIIGGGSVFSPFLEQKQPGNLAIDAAYIATFKEAMVEPGDENATFIGSSALDTIKRIKNLIECESPSLAARHTLDTIVAINRRNDSGEISSALMPVEFTYLYNSSILSPESASINSAGILRFVCNAGAFTIPIDEIVGYRESRLVASLTLLTKRQEIEVRMPEGKPGINYLQHLIDQHLITKAVK